MVCSEIGRVSKLSARECRSVMEPSSCDKAASPARSASGSSHASSDYSRESRQGPLSLRQQTADAVPTRLSHLSRPRSLSKDQLSTEDPKLLC